MSSNFLTSFDKWHATLPVKTFTLSFLMIFLLNLWQILFKAPQIIGIIKAIIDIVGSTQVQNILMVILDALKIEIPNLEEPPTTEPERERLVKRFLRRWNEVKR